MIAHYTFQLCVCAVCFQENLKTCHFALSVIRFVSFRLNANQIVYFSSIILFLTSERLLKFISYLINKLLTRYRDRAKKQRLHLAFPFIRLSFEYKNYLFTLSTRIGNSIAECSSICLFIFFYCCCCCGCLVQFHLSRVL